MVMLKLNEILKSTSYEIEVSGISYDSRKTKPGDVFVAVTGFQTDGHKYVKTAEEKGAVCAVVGDFVYDRVDFFIDSIVYFDALKKVA